MGTLLALDLRDYLASGLSTSDTVTAGRLAAFPDRQIGVIESGGLPSTHTMASGPGLAVMEWPRVQILSRAATYQAAVQIAQNVHGLLDGLRERTINGTRYHWSEAVQQPFMLEEDANNRVVIACNYQIAKAHSTSTST
jgi:hypothetical protein